MRIIAAVFVVAVHCGALLYVNATDFNLSAVSLYMVIAVFAKACGFKIAGLSFVSNLAAGISRRELNHQEVVDAAAGAKVLMKAFFEDFLARL